MTELDYFLFIEKNKPKGDLLWFALKSKDFEILEGLINDGYIPAMLEKFKMALNEGCFEEAHQLKEMLMVSFDPESNPELVEQVKNYMEMAINEAVEDYKIVE